MIKTLLLTVILSLSNFTNLYAQAVPIPSAPTLAASSYVLLDFNSGKILEEKNPHKRIEPASITKIMTSYAVYTALKSGSISMDDEVLVSEKAWRMKGSRMFIEVGKRVSLADLLKGLIIQSGNDASVALAEHIAGSEDNFAEYMNGLAKKLGMKNSHFVNATGWPAKEHHTTAHDVALLALALIKEFPEKYKLYKEKKFTYNNITQYNRNKLLWRDKSVDGMKTGHTEAAGYCLVSSAKRDDMRLISVVMGTKSDKSRTKESQKLLGFGFRFYDSRKLYSNQQKVDSIKVWKGKTDLTDVVVAKNVIVVIPRGQEKQLKASIEVPASLQAPLSKGQKVGSLVVKLDGKEISRTDIVVAKGIEQGSIFKRAMDSVKQYFE